MVKAAEMQLDKLHRSLLQIVGNNHIAEELQAQVEASVKYINDSKNNESTTTVLHAAPTIDITDSDNDMGHSQLKLLERISAIAGLGNEKLAHELYFNPSWHLPEVKLPTFEAMLSNQVNSNDLHEKMKSQLLRLIGDRLIWSLKSSTITSHDDVKEGNLILLKLLLISLLLFY